MTLVAERQKLYAIGHVATGDTWFFRPYADNTDARSGGLLPASFPICRFNVHLDRGS